MIRRLTLKNFKRFREHSFELADSVVLAGPNNAGKSTLLQAIATWKLGLDRWVAQREGGRAVKRSGVAITTRDPPPWFYSMSRTRTSTSSSSARCTT